MDERGEGELGKKKKKKNRFQAKVGSEKTKATIRF